jgi:TonB family protein
MSSHQPPPGPSPRAESAAPAARTSELRFLLPEQPNNYRTMLGGATAVYALAALVVLLLVVFRPPLPTFVEEPREPLDITDIVFLNTPGPGGGGGGGGNRSPEPPKTTPTPIVKPPEPKPEPIPVPEPVPVPQPEPVVEPPPVVAPILPTQETTLAVVAAGPPSVGTPSLGSGDGPGAGTGKGGGIGSGSGGGLGSGTGEGCCEGLAGPGSGASQPIALNNPRPNYTSDAMLRRIQGEVTLQCIVTKAGLAEKCSVIRPLDSNNYGLDNEALKTATRYRFKPASLKGEPVAMQVNIIIEFRMR